MHTILDNSAFNCAGIRGRGASEALLHIMRDASQQEAGYYSVLRYTTSNRLLAVSQPVICNQSRANSTDPWADSFSCRGRKLVCTIRTGTA